MRCGAERTFVVRILAILLLLGAIGATAAIEPDGPVAFRPIWSEPDPASREAELRGPGTELRIDVTPGVEMARASLEVRLPPGVAGVSSGTADASTVRTEIEADGTTVLHVALGDLVAGAARVLRFRLRLDRVEGAVATFAVHGTAVDGTPVRDAVGVVVGVPGTAPRSRHGAFEFRAVPTPDPNASDR